MVGAGDGCGDDVEPRGVHRLLDDREAPPAQITRQPRARLAFAAGGGVDIDERPRQRDDVDLVHCHAAIRPTTLNAELAKPAEPILLFALSDL